MDPEPAAHQWNRHGRHDASGGDRDRAHPAQIRRDVQDPSVGRQHRPARVASDGHRAAAAAPGQVGDILRELIGDVRLLT